MPLILEGSTAAAAIRAAAAVRATAVANRIGRPATLAAVAIQPAPNVPLYFDVKERAFAESNARFQAHVLPAETTTASLSEYIARLNDDDGVDGIFVQYPLPTRIDAQVAYDRIAPAKDVDAAGIPLNGAWHFMPATAEAVLHLLAFHNIETNACDVCIVRGDPLFAEALAMLFRAAGARPSIMDGPANAHGASVRGCIHTADIVVVATGVVNGISAAAFRNDVVAVDVGYYHGGGRGDISAHPDDIARMRAYATPRGSIGPLTVAILIDHTVRAAEELHEQRARK